MRDLKLFATVEQPLHASGLRGLLECPWRVVVRYLTADTSDESGEAADTGSAMHRAAAALHTGSGVAASLEAMRGSTADYPRADLQDAAALFLAYAADPRNADVSQFVLVERQIAFSIQAAPEDPTGAPISVVGTLDQVRRERDGRLRLWDIKTSKKDPMEVLNASQVQIAAYCVGASILLGETVHPGGIIAPRRYPKNAFWTAAWTFQDLETVLQGVRHMVARVRSGDVWHVAGPACTWCHMKTPDLCVPKLRQLVRA